MTDSKEGHSVPLRNRVLGACGMLSAVMFIAADLLGASLRPGYSSIEQAISELIEVGAPNKPLLDGLLLLFHFLVVPFAYGLHRGVERNGRHWVAPTLLAGAGIAGVVLTLFFPCDPGCEPETWRGIMHIVIAIPMGVSVLLSILAFSYRFAGDRGWVGYRRYSVLTFTAGVMMAVLTVAMAETAVVGLLERILTAVYLQWYMVVGMALFRSNS